MEPSSAGLRAASIVKRTAARSAQPKGKALDAEQSTTLALRWDAQLVLLSPAWRAELSELSRGVLRAAPRAGRLEVRRALRSSFGLPTPTVSSTATC